MKYRKYFIVVIISILILTGFSQYDDNNQNNNPDVIESFFKTYEEDSPKKAVEYIFSSNKWINSINKGKRDSLGNNLDLLIKHLGAYQGYEVFKSNKAGESYRVVSCLAKYERQPIRFNFVLYKPNSVWQIQNFTYDINVEEELSNTVNLSFEF
ncbi:hypothetical protein GTQ40_12425 [Flavobacteriaceae bacterium R38]|nr:hypothetical protein [Flavobacteriaceae bacterium R38]